MQLEWLGKYRNFFENLFLYTNIYGQIYTLQGFYRTSVPCSLAQIQVLEYILENEEKNQKMAEIAKRLGISASAFSKNVKKMTEKGLLEKYQSTTNHKDIIIKVSPLGRNIYKEYVTALLELCFQKTLEILDEIPQQSIDRFADILKLNADSMIAQLRQHQEETDKTTKNTTMELVKIQ